MIDLKAESYSQASAKSPNHLPGLDVLRGWAALTIATVWHFGALTGNKDSHPVFGQDGIFMTDGYLGVDLFFMLSGMVIAHVYLDAISNEKISVYKYMLKRIARIWPLHLLTLNLAALFFWLNFKVLGETVSTCKFETYDYFMNVLFLQSSWFSRGCSFNAPSWTLSIEMFLYLSFFLVTVLVRLKAWSYFVIALIGFWMITGPQNWGLTPNYGRGFFAFYLGVVGLPYFLTFVSYLRRIPFANCMIILATLMAYFVFAVYFRYDVIGFNSDKYQVFDFRYMQYRVLFYDVFFFPALICLFAGVVVAIGENWLTRFLGNVSFSSYLIHIPLIFMLKLVMGVLGIDLEVFNSITGWLIFIFILLGVSHVSFTKLEVPAKRWISGF